MGSLESCAVYLDEMVEYHCAMLKITLVNQDSLTWLTTNVQILAVIYLSFSSFESASVSATVIELRIVL